MNILIVEDDWVTARSVAESLQQAGHLVTVATSRADVRFIVGFFDVGVFDTLCADSTTLDLAGELLRSGAIATALLYSGCFASQLLDDVAAVVEKAKGGP
jgi:DNA-binding response OmpR family regulator